MIGHEDHAEWLIIKWLQNASQGDISISRRARDELKRTIARSLEEEVEIYKAAYEKALENKAGQASKPPLKWPTSKQVYEFQEETQIYDVDEVIEWLKQHMEEKEK